MSGPWIAAFGALWVVTLGIGLAVLGILRRFSAVLEAAEARVSAQNELGAPVRSTVADFKLYDESGRVALTRDAVNEPTLLLFVEPGCGACRQLVQELDGTGATLDGVPFAIVIEDSRRARAFAFPEGVRVVYEQHGDVFRAFRNRATPQAYVIDNEGLVLARKVPASALDLHEMARFQREGGDAHRSLPAAVVHV